MQNRLISPINGKALSSGQGKAQSGFTLLEVMVVLTIIGLMLGMATLSSGGNELKQQAQQQIPNY